MKITSLVENTSKCELKARHGLSLYIETQRHFPEPSVFYIPGRQAAPHLPGEEAGLQALCPVQQRLRRGETERAAPAYL